MGRLIRQLLVSIGLSNRTIRFLVLGIWALRYFNNAYVIEQLRAFWEMPIFKKQTHKQIQLTRNACFDKLHRSAFIDTVPGGRQTVLKNAGKSTKRLSDEDDFHNHTESRREGDYYEDRRLFCQKKRDVHNIRIC